jgi:uncharacterized membrane protein (UPF0127 family)
VGLGLIGGGLVLLGVATAVAASILHRLGGQEGNATPSPETAAVYGGHSYLCVEVASTPEARAVGLSGRDELGPYDGMAFLFPDAAEARGSFWMKDTRFPLDLVFVGRDGKVQRVERMEPCEGDDCPLHAPSAPYLYALELPAGHAEEFGLVPGTPLRLEGGCLPVDRE